MCGSFNRVFVMLITGTEMRLPVPGPRFDCLMSGRPGSSNFCSEPLLLGRPISGNWLEMTRPPRSNTRKMSPGIVVSHAGSGYSLSRMPLPVMNALTGTGLTIVAPSPEGR